MQPKQRVRFYIWVVGLDQLLLGLAMLFLPWRFADARYDALQTTLAIVGALLALSGITLLTWQVLPLPRGRVPVGLRLLAALAYLLLIAGFIQTQAWASVCTFGILCLGLLLAAIDGGRRMSRLRVDLFMLVVALEEASYGALLLLTPARLLGVQAHAAQQHQSAWGIVLLAGAALLVLSQAWRHRRGRWLLGAFAALPLLAWMYALGIRANAPGTVITAVMLTLGLVIRPALPSAWLLAPHRRLANKLIAVSVGSLGSALVVLAVLLLRQTESAYIQRAQLDLTTTARVVAGESATFLDNRIEQATLASRDPEVLSFDPRLQFPFINRVLQADPAISQISIVNSEGITVVRSTGEQPNVDRRGLLAGVDEVFRTHQPQWDVIVSPTQQVPVLAVRVPIFNEDGSFQGIYVNQVRLTTLSRQLSEVPLGRSGRIVVVDSDGKVIASPDPNLVATRADLTTLPPVAAALAGRPSPLVYRDGDMRWLSVQAPVPQLGWTVLVERPEADVLAPAYHAREEALSLLALMLLLTTVSTVLLARRISGPLVALSRAARRLGGGAAEVTLPAASEDEVGDLVHAFGDMQGQLAERTRERGALLAREQEARAEAETFAEIGRAISSSLDLSQVLDITAKSAARLVEADLTCIALNRSQAGMELVTVVGNRTKLIQELPGSTATAIFQRSLASERPLQMHLDDQAALNAMSPQVFRALTEERVASTLALPIRHGLRGLGVFWVHSRRRREFSEVEVSLLERLTILAGTAIANAQTHAEEQEARAEVEALLEATESLGVQTDPEAVLRTLIEQAALLLQADRAVYGVERDGNRLIPGNWIRGTWIPGGYEPAGNGVVAGVWDSGVPYLTNDLANDPNANPEMVQRFGSHSLLAVPLPGAGGESIGVVMLNNSTRPEGFTARDRRLLLAICKTGGAILTRANETATRLEAERQAARRKREVEALLAAADQLNSSLDPEEILLHVVGLAADLLAVQRIGIATNEGDHALRRHIWVDGTWHSEPSRVPLEGSVTGWVIKHGRPYRSDDFANDPAAFSPAPLGVSPTTALSVPILARDGAVMGALNLFNRRDGQPFTDDDQRLAEGIARHAGLALERARLMQELRQREEHLREQAVTDPLTGLPNRVLFLDRVAAALARAKRHGGGVGVLFLDLDGFKIVNDSLGHSAGDELLQMVGQCLLRCRRAGDTVARFGGDEFAVLVEHVNTSTQVTKVAERILGELRESAWERRQGLLINASIGVSYRSGKEESCSPEELVREADIALYRAKATGKGHVVSFMPEMSVRAVERLELQTDLQRALERGELRLYYQPIVSFQSQTVIGAEALLRWAHPERGMLRPDTFIPMAEETGLILPIGQWVLREACKQARAWQPHRAGDQPFRVSVNLSVRQLEQRDLVDQVAAALRRSRLDPAQLELEITESALLQPGDTTVGVLAGLKDLGVKLAIDDFGTGYSSLSYLQRLTVDTLKIDRSFIEGLAAGTPAAAIVQAVIMLAHALNIAVTAEGVETAEHLSVLAALGCDYAQGYYFSEPRDPSELASLVLPKLPKLPPTITPHLWTTEA